MGRRGLKPIVIPTSRGELNVDRVNPPFVLGGIDVEPEIPITLNYEPDLEQE